MLPPLPDSPLQGERVAAYLQCLGREAGFQEGLTAGYSSLCGMGLQQQGLMAFCL